jgi:cyclic-di-GMP-binding protein
MSWLKTKHRERFMASTFSFDVVSKFDFQELKNAVDQAQREIHQRYDLKDTGTEITLTEKDITISTASEYSLQAVKDTLESKLIKRGLSLKILDFQKEEQASGGRVRQHIKLREGLNDEIAKKLSKQIRDEFKKVTPQIQGDLIRVQAKNKDDLQAVIHSLKGMDDLPVALQFVNYR